MGIQEVRNAFHFPAEPPAVPSSNEGWFVLENEELLRGALGPNTKTVVELGSWLGKSTRFIASHAPNAIVLAVDHWRGSAEHYSMPEKALLPMLYEMFIRSCWSLRDRIVPLRMDTVSGIKFVHQHGIRPDLVYIDAAHEYQSAKEDIWTALDLFPDAAICGDDFAWEGVGRAVRERAANGTERFYSKAHVWWKEGSAFKCIQGGTRV